MGKSIDANMLKEKSSKKDTDALHYALLFADTDAKLCRRLMQFPNVSMMLL